MKTVFIIDDDTESTSEYIAKVKQASSQLLNGESPGIPVADEAHCIHDPDGGVRCFVMHVLEFAEHSSGLRCTQFAGFTGHCSEAIADFHAVTASRDKYLEGAKLWNDAARAWYVSEDNPHAGGHQNTLDHVGFISAILGVPYGDEFDAYPFVCRLRVQLMASSASYAEISAALHAGIHYTDFPCLYCIWGLKNAQRNNNKHDDSGLHGPNFKVVEIIMTLSDII